MSVVSFTSTLQVKQKKYYLMHIHSPWNMGDSLQHGYAIHTVK